MEKEKIVLVGGGGHCHSVIDVIEQENRFEIMGIIDKSELLGQKVLGYEVIACDEDLPEIFKSCKNAVVTVGQIKSATLRKKLFSILNEIGFSLPIIVSPLAYVSKHSVIAKGSVVMHQAVVNANVKIGENCIINTKALIEHDSSIGNNCHISTSAVVNGGVKIKDETFYGSNATSKEYIEVEGFIKAGSVVK